MKRAAELNSRAKEMYQNKDYKSALEIYNRACKLHPADVKYISNRAATRMMTSHYFSVIDDCKVAIAIFDGNARFG